MDDPRASLRAWLPHLLMIALLGLGLALMAQVLLPLLEPILLAAALAMLTGPVLADPLDRWAARLWPSGDPTLRRRLVGSLAAVLIAAALVAPILLLLIRAVGSLGGVVDIGIGLALRDPERLKALEQLFASELRRLADIYPHFGLEPAAMAAWLRGLLDEALDFGPAFLGFIFAGTGALAHLALAFICLAFFSAEGPRLGHRLLELMPLDEAQSQRLRRRYRTIVLRLLHDTVANALVCGLLLAAWIIFVDRLTGRGALPFIPIALVAAVISLLPVVGVAMVWLPLAGLAWTSGQALTALLLAIGCTAIQVLLARLRQRQGRRIDERSAWLAFLLFLGLIGGLLRFGIKGLVIGPAAVVLVSLIAGFWFPLYGIGSEHPASEDEGEGEDEERSTPQ